MSDLERRAEELTQTETMKSPSAEEIAKRLRHYADTSGPGALMHFAADLIEQLLSENRQASAAYDRKVRELVDSFRQDLERISAEREAYREGLEEISNERPHSARGFDAHTLTPGAQLARRILAENDR